MENKKKFNGQSFIKNVLDMKKIISPKQLKYPNWNIMQELILQKNYKGKPNLIENKLNIWIYYLNIFKRAQIILKKIKETKNRKAKKEELDKDELELYLILSLVTDNIQQLKNILSAKDEIIINTDFELILN